MGKKHPGSRTRKCKEVSKTWTNKINNTALPKRRSVPNSTEKVAAQAFDVNKGTLRSHLKRKAKEQKINKADCSCVFDTEAEERLAKCIALVCNYGFSPSMKQIEVSAYMDAFFTRAY